MTDALSEEVLAEVIAYRKALRGANAAWREYLAAVENKDSARVEVTQKQRDTLSHEVRARLQRLNMMLEA